MRGFRKTIDKWANTGVSPTSTDRRKFQTRAANIAGFLFTAASLPYIPFEYGMGAPALALGTVISCFVFPLALPLNHYGFSRSARALPLVTACFMVWVATAALTPACQVQLGLFMLGSWAFTLYDTREEWVQLTSILVLIAATYLSINLGWLPQISDAHPSPELIRTYTWIMPVSALVLNSAVMSLLYVRNQANEDRLISANATLNEAHQRAMLGEKSKAEFLAVMTHEIRTPLNGVLGCAELIKSEPLTNEQEQWLKTLVASSEYMLDLMTHILEYSRLDSGKQELQASEVAIASLVRDTVDSFRERAASKKVALEFEADFNVPERVVVDPGRLRLIVSNLVSNAVKYTLRGQVTVRVRCVAINGLAAELEISVADTGPGIDAALHQAIFESFRQADDFNRRREGGVGLGLAICKAAAELMKGSLALESIVGHGSLFRLRLPVTVAVTSTLAVSSRRFSVQPVQRRVSSAKPESSEQDTSPISDVSPVTQEVPSSVTKLIRRILIADDQPTNQRILQKLAERFGEQVLVVENGALALEAWEEHAPDVILMDIQMPVMDGLTATRAIRAHEGRCSDARHTAIIAVTANALPEQRAEGLEAGLDAYLTKPVRIAELREALERLCPPRISKSG